MEGKIRKHDEETQGIQENEKAYLQVGGWRFCLLCRQWNDAQHRGALRHLAKMRHFGQMDARQQALHLANQQVLADEKLRAGAVWNGEERSPILNRGLRCRAACVAGTTTAR